MNTIYNRLRNKTTRFVHLRNIDTIESIRSRNSDYAALRQRVCEAGTDNQAAFGDDYTHEGGLYLQQNPDEFTSLCLFLKEHRPFRNYIEIGSASGGACLLLHKEVGFDNILSLDDGQHPRATEQKQNFSHLPNFKQFIGDSHSEPAKQFLTHNLEGKVDVAFIDGDHSYEGVAQDVELTLPFCRPGTLLIFHDTIACPGVRDTWLDCVRTKVLLPLAEYAGEGKAFGIAVGAVK